MCLAIPGKIIRVADPPTDVPPSPLLRTGSVDFGGVIKDVSLAYVPEAGVGDYVIVHVGFAISRLDEDEAEQTFRYLREIEELAEREAATP